MIIRQATAADWPRIYPIYAAVMAEGEDLRLPRSGSRLTRPGPGGWRNLRVRPGRALVEEWADVTR